MKAMKMKNNKILIYKKKISIRVLELILLKVIKYNLIQIKKFK
jgi:hypothetical protein